MWRTAALAGAVLLGAMAHAAEPLEPAGELTLSTALGLARARSPELQAGDRLVEAQDGAIRQAGMLPNPLLEGETEDLAGSGRFRLASQPQTTVRLSQTIPIGGDRGRRVAAAALGGTLAAWDRQGRDLDVTARVTRAFVDVQAAQDLLAVTGEAERLAARVAGTVAERVAAGFASPVEETRARVAAATTEIERQAAERTLESARWRLAATWNAPEPRFARVTGALPIPSVLPELAVVAAARTGNPELARADAEVERRLATVAVERARAIPDVTLSAGYRRFHDTDNNALVVGAAVPIPLFDRNQGGIAEAAARVAAATEDRRALDAQLRAAVAEAYRLLASAHAELRLLDRRVLPGSEGAYTAAQEGYRGGKFGLMDVLDAQRTLFGVRARRVQATAGFHKARADVERLIGGPMPGVDDGEER